MKKIFSHKFFRATKTYVLAHKVVTLIVLIIALTVGYWSYSKLTATLGETRYVLSSVEKGTIVSSVTGSGQVSALDQIDLKPKVSGDVVWIGVSAGTEVKHGQAILSLDGTDAQKAVTDAKLALAESKLQLDKDTAQAPIDYDRKLESQKTAEADLKKEYKNIYSVVSKTYLDLPTIVTGLEDVLYGENIDPRSQQWNVNVYRNLFDSNDGELVNILSDIAEKEYKTARELYDKSFLDFKSINLSSTNIEFESTLDKTLTSAEAVAQVGKSEANLIDTIIDIGNKKNIRLSTIITTFQTNLHSYISTVNNTVTSVVSEQSALQNAKENLTNIGRDLSIMKVNNPTGVKPIDLQISENSISRKESDLADLLKKLYDYTVRAPFDGTIAKISVKKNDSVGSGTAVATLVTNKKIAEITLNEVDIAKVKNGQKVTLTFDAISGLSVTGEVSEIDTLGTVSQGVVNYSVKIIFDTQDDRIKSSMSVSAAIITDIRQDVLIVPGSAVKTQGAMHYVEVLVRNQNVTNSQNTGTGNTQSQANLGVTSPTPPTQVPVEIGISNDTSVEIISGLTEGQKIITRTIKPSTQTTNATAPSLFGGAGNRGATGGNAIRIMR